MILALALCCGVISIAQQVDTLYISPNVSAEVDAFVQFNNGNPTTQDANFSQSGVLLIDAWTSGGQLKVSRSLMKWDFSSIPTGSTIQSATLQLFHNTNSSTGNSTEAGTNEAWVERITQAWDGATVAWSTQPPTTTVDRVQLPTDNPVGVRNIQSDASVDLTNIVQHFMDNPNDRHGIKISLATEEFYRRRTYFSSDYTDPTKHPRLILEYTTPVMATPNLQPEYCDVELGLDDRIKSIRINGATSYEFRFDDGNGNVFTHVSPNNRVKLKNVVPLPEYGTSYDVSVRASDGTTTTPYGTACQITIENIPAPGIDKTVNGRTDVLMDEALQADKVIGATAYEFEVTNIDDGYTENIISNNRNLKIKQLSEGAFYNTNYRVTVRAIVDANTGPYGQVSIFRTTNVVTETTQLKDRFIDDPNVDINSIISFKPIKYVREHEVIAFIDSIGYDTIVLIDTNKFTLKDFPKIDNHEGGVILDIDITVRASGQGIIGTTGGVVPLSGGICNPRIEYVGSNPLDGALPCSGDEYTYRLRGIGNCTTGSVLWTVIGAAEINGSPVTSPFVLADDNVIDVTWGNQPNGVISVATVNTCGGVCGVSQNAIFTAQPHEPLPNGTVINSDNPTVLNFGQSYLADFTIQDPYAFGFEWEELLNQGIGGFGSAWELDNGQGTNVATYETNSYSNESVTGVEVSYFGGCTRTYNLRLDYTDYNRPQLSHDWCVGETDFEADINNNISNNAWYEVRTMQGNSAVFTEPIPTVNYGYTTIAGTEALRSKIDNKISMNTNGEPTIPIDVYFYSNGSNASTSPNDGYSDMSLPVADYIGKFTYNLQPHVVQSLVPLTYFEITSSDYCNTQGNGEIINLETSSSVTHDAYVWKAYDNLQNPVDEEETQDNTATLDITGLQTILFSLEVYAKNICDQTPVETINTLKSQVQPLIQPVIVAKTPADYCGGFSNTFEIDLFYQQTGNEYCWHMKNVLDVDGSPRLFDPVCGLDKFTYTPYFGESDITNPNGTRDGEIASFDLEVYSRNCTGVTSPIETYSETAVVYNGCGGGGSFSIALAPNPTSNQLSVTIPQGDGSMATIDITDIYGVVRKSVQSYNLVETINVSNLPLGTYNVCVVKGNEMDIQHLQILP